MKGQQGVMSPFHMSTWNVEGKGSAAYIDEILSSTEFKRKETAEEENLHIVCIQQANLPSGGESENYRWLCSGEFGSAVLISKNTYFKSWSFSQVCEQICMAEVAVDDQTVLIIISCYIPPRSECVTGDLWPKLIEVVKTIPSNATYFLAGDFNAKLGKEDTYPDGIDRGRIGRKLHHKNSNENGVFLKKLTVNCHAKIINTFEGSSTPDYTHQNEGKQSQRSYIIVPYDQVPLQSSLQECQLIWHPDYNHAVLSTFLKPMLYEKLSQLISSEIVVSSWNVQGASTFAVDKALNELDLSVVCVQGVLLTSDNDVETENFKWFTSKKLWGKNVGILIKTSPNISMTDFEVVSEYLCMGNINLKGRTVKVISCCLPAHTDSAMFKEVGEKLTDLVKSFAAETPFVVAGDFNTNVIFTVIGETLVFDEGDGNALFLQKFMQENNMGMTYMPESSVTMASEKTRRNSSHVLISPSCLMKYSHKRFVHWVPYNESSIVTLCLTESNQEDTKLASQLCQTDLEEKNQENGVKRKIGFLHEEVKKVGEFTRRIKKCSNLYTQNLTLPLGKGTKIWKGEAREQSDLPMDIVEKYQETCVPTEELYSILGDEFTLYHGFVRESSVITRTVEILADSFESLNRGGVMMENIDVYQGHLPYKRIVKFKWNGIVIHEDEGSTRVNFKKTNELGQLALMDKLARHFCTVRAKKSFYNKGLPPKCTDISKLNEVIRVLDGGVFPFTASSNEGQQFIDEFFKENPHLELLFGPHLINMNFFESIKKYATKKNLGFRYFKSKFEVNHWDNIVLFIKRTPLEVRKRLKKLPGQQDLKFYLIPPCEGNINYQEWTKQWVKKYVPDEIVYFQNQDVGVSNPATSLIVPNQRKENKRKRGRYRAEAKRAKSEVYDTEVCDRPRWEEVAPLIVIWPITICSENENNPKKVLEANFPTEFKMEPNNRVAVFVTLPLRNWCSKRYCLCKGNDFYSTTSHALDIIVEHSSVIKHTQQYLPSRGGVPNFIRYNIPCQANPRTYIFLSKNETGPLTHAIIAEIFYNLKSSFNDDVFFDRDSYTHGEKQLLLDLASQHNLKVRHFGDDHRLVNRYVCVYKIKPKDVILNEVMRMRDLHPKYMLAT